MVAIHVTDRHVVYQNPSPETSNQHGSFPGLASLGGSELLALFVVGTEFEAADATTFVSRSTDRGRTWQPQGPLHAKGEGHRFDADSLKPTLLPDGRLMAIGYRFHRTDPAEALVNADTGGVRPGDDLVSFSTDSGRTWTLPREIPRSRPELIEISGPAVVLSDGSLVAVGSLFPTWEGKHPNGNVGVLLRSVDGGQTWDDRGLFFVDPSGRHSPSEPRLCEMQPGRLVAMVWMADHEAGVNRTNHVTVSHDFGRTWSEPIDTGVPGQASNLMHWRDDLLLSVHAQREGTEIGVVVRVVDFSGDRWRTVHAENIWGNAPAMKVGTYASMGQSLRFGQPSLLRLGDDEVLATHWAIEGGQGRILTHRLRIEA